MRPPARSTPATTGPLDAHAGGRTAPGTRRPLKFEYLVTRGSITRDQLAATMVEARDQQVSVESLLMLKHEIPKGDIGHSLSLFYRCPFISFDHHVFVSPDLVRSLSPERLKRGGWIPLERDGSVLMVLTKDPYDLPELDAIGHFFPHDKINPAVGFPDDIRKLIDDTFHGGARMFKDLGGGEGPEFEPDDADASMEADVKDSDNAIIHLANQIIEDADHERASDIHIEPCSLTRQTIIRFRVDGTCFEYRRVPAAVARPLGTRSR